MLTLIFRHWVVLFMLNLLLLLLILSDSMKQRTKEFIKTMNTQEYSQRLKVMIDHEKVCHTYFPLKLNLYQSWTPRIIHGITHRITPRSCDTQAPGSGLTSTDALTQVEKQQIFIKKKWLHFKPISSWGLLMVAL